MRNDGDIIIISTQSRKGGVGKTTVALNLAKLTLGDESEVVFLDMDIAGTASDTFDKILIAPKVHIVNDSETKTKNESLNLVALFERYMTGMALPAISCKKEKKGPYIQLVPGEINVFSSFLERDGSGKHEYSYGPAALFDEMHSVWFIEMLKELVKKCADAFQSVKKKNLIVIIDNAPGYSGLEPAIEEWLTDLGPECGKFIFVGSLDPQDFLACIKGLIGIHNLYCDKWDAFQEYLYLLQEENVNERNLSEGNLNERSQAFIQRLFENRSVENTPCPQTAPPKKSNPYCSYCGLCFYFQKCSDTGNNKYKEAAQNYLAFVLSKTPTATLARYNYKTDLILTKLGRKSLSNEEATLDNFFEYISDCGDNIPAGIVSMLKDSFEHPKDIMIPFKSAYAQMFFVRGLVLKERVREITKDFDALKDTSINLLNRITSFDSYAKVNAVDSSESSNNIPHATKSSYLGISVREGIELICEREKLLDELDNSNLIDIKALGSGYERLLPYYRNFIKLLFKYLGLKVLDEGLNEQYGLTNDKEFNDKIILLIESLEIARFIDVPYSVTPGVLETRNNFIPFSIARDILIAIAFSESKEWNLYVQGRQQDVDLKKIQKLSFFMMGIVSIVIRDYYKAYTTYKPVIELEQWIWLELANKVNITKKIANVVAEGYPLGRQNIDITEIPLALSVFRAFCVAQARFMDFIRQPEATMNLLVQQPISTDKGKIDYREGRQEETTDIEQATKEIKKMQEYNSCLGPILKKWGILKDKQ